MIKIKYLTLILSMLNISCISILAEDKVSFNSQIRPILSDKCYFCHGPDAADIQGNLQLHEYEYAVADRPEFGPAIVPGNKEQSKLWHRITSEDPTQIMPPANRHMPLTKKEIESIGKWIDEGAEYEGLWSFSPLPKEVPVPAPTFNTAKNELDHFVGKKLKKENLAPAKEADKLTLLRRVYLTLTGLAPTPEQIVEYQQDKQPGAYERLVDKLTASQEFAEHLMVDWMDVSRYADSYGFQVDKARQVWPWRDWTLNAFKNNIPYDQFILHQIAGDMIPDADQDSTLATAFNRLHMQKVEGGSLREEFRVEYVADRAQTAATAFLGITLECARCHDHKYDPISQEDYFKTFALFNNINENGIMAFFVNPVPSPSIPLLDENKEKQLAQKEAALQAALDKLPQVIHAEKAAFATWKESWDKKIDVSNPLTHYNFDETQDGVILNQNKANYHSHYDPTQNRYNTTYIKRSKGFVGNGLLLDGDTAVNVGDVGPFERHLPFSISLRFNTPEQYKLSAIILRSRAAEDAANRGYELMMDEGRLNFALVHFYPGNEIRIRSKKKVSINSWHQVTATYEGSSKAHGLSLYLNGEKLDCEILSDHLTKEIYYSKPEAMRLAKEGKEKLKKENGGSKISIGALFRGSGLRNASVDDFFQFDRCLSAIEARELYKAGSNTAPTDEELFAYYLSRHSAPYTAALASAQAKHKELNEFMNGQFHMMVMKELTQRKKTYVLERGLFSAPNHDREVEPGPPSKIFPFGEEYTRDRLGFAKWLLHPEHPLTARVTVNRYWQRIFGTGIVSTANDFGFQGALPSNQALLDYLSRRFIDSGWDLKALFKFIVMSHSFQQDSNATAELRERDPDNQLLARGPAQMLSAEMLRDNALNAAGVLQLKFGGRGVEPNRPHKGKYRRSLYSNWKRNSPHPELLMFGTPRRQVCAVQREKTTTPLQSLVLMNSPLYVNSAKALAARVAENQLEPEERIKEMFLLATGREAKTKEADILKKLYEEQLSYFQTQPEVAKALSTKRNESTQELAAWWSVANTILNLDAFYMMR